MGSLNRRRQASRLANTVEAAALAVPKFAVLFRDDLAVGVTRVEAASAEAAEALVLEQHAGGSVKALGDEQVTADNRHRVLAKWMQTLDA